MRDSGSKRIEFQSTPSGGKATSVAGSAAPVARVSIHAFRGEGDRRALQRIRQRRVSIHAFRGEGDNDPSFARQGAGVFQSTPSGGKATEIADEDVIALLSFNPRLPGGRRLVFLNNRVQRGMFQSTPSGGKATSSVA